MNESLAKYRLNQFTFEVESNTSDFRHHKGPMVSTDCNGSDIGMDVLDEKVLDMAHIRKQDRTEIRTQDRNEIRTQNHTESRIQYHMVSGVVQID